MTKTRRELIWDITMGNRWNNKTLRLPRPKVCKSPIPPPFKARCAIRPESVTGKVGEEAIFQVLAWNENLEFGTLVGMTVEALISQVENTNDPTNRNTFSGDFQLQNTGEAGVDIVSVTLTFSDNSQCTEIINFGWIDNGDP